MRLDLRGILTLACSDDLIPPLDEVVVGAVPAEANDADAAAADADATMLGRSGLEYLLRIRAWMTLLPSDVDRGTFRSASAGGRGRVDGMLLGLDEEAGDLVRLLLPGTPVPASAVDVVVLDAMPSEEADCAMARTTSPAVPGRTVRRPLAEEEELVLGLLLCLLLLVLMFAELE